MIKMIIVGAFLSLIFIYLSLHGVDFAVVADSIAGFSPWAVLLCVSIVLLRELIRSLRWKLILSPLGKVGLRYTFPINAVGIMGVILIPLRIGELVKPYLLSTNCRYKFSTAVGTILVERVMDGIVLLAMALLLSAVEVSSDSFQRTSLAAAVLFPLLFIVLFLVYAQNKVVLRLADRLFGLLPSFLAGRLSNAMASFIEGIRILGSPLRLGLVLLYSFAIWSFSGLMIFVISRFMGLNLGSWGVMTVLVFTVIGISIPALPGHLGTFQYSCILALATVGIAHNQALAFSVIYFLMGIGSHILLGLACLWFVSFSWRSFYHSVTRQRHALNQDQTD
ncbi:MAG: UPF0104 family protein [Desulfarculus sp.]|jgi:uncharacterized protein (TIRG00374 family)|nr:MAG: UPF0104 family protein [Desulfarculus sp.]